MERYKVTLTKEERNDLLTIINRGKHSSQKIRNSYILLNADEGEFSEKVTNKKMSEVLKIGMRTIDRVKKKFVEHGLESVFERNTGTRVYEKKADGDFEAHLISICCSKAPDGFARWSLRLLSEKMVELKYVESVSHETIRKVLKKNELKPWKVTEWCIPAKQSGQFVADMEHVLDVYKQPYNEKYPLVCMDESPKQLIGEIRQEIDMKCGSEKKIDSEYVRNGVCEIFIATEPLSGKRIVKVTETRTKKDWAEFIKELADHYKEAEKIRLVMDNLNTHCTGSLYDTFKPEDAKQIADRFEFIFTPKHGSWLNMAEIELNVLQNQCLGRRIPEIETVKKEVEAWQEDRNNKEAKINWQFTSKDARIKLKRLYPSFED